MLDVSLEHLERVLERFAHGAQDHHCLLLLLLPSSPSSSSSSSTARAYLELARHHHSCSSMATRRSYPTESFAPRFLLLLGAVRCRPLRRLPLRGVLRFASASASIRCVRGAGGGREGHASQERERDKKLQLTDRWGPSVEGDVGVWLPLRMTGGVGLRWGPPVGGG